MLKQFLECELRLEKIVCDCIGNFSVKISIRLEFDCLNYLKIRVKWPLSKRPKIGFQNQLSLNAGQKYCRML